MGFKEALRVLVKHEGGYVNDPRDHGGETYRGISRKFYPKWNGWKIVDMSDKDSLDGNLDLMEEVADFYYTYYWFKLKCDNIEDEFIAQMLFNFAVNMGKRTIIKKVQRILQVKQDGLIGQITIGALNRMNTNEFVYHFLLEIIEFYIQIGKKQPHYLVGWLNRAIAVYYSYERR